MRTDNSRRKLALVLLLAAPMMAGCSSASNVFSSDVFSTDAGWFSRTGRVFIKNVSIDAPPLTPEKTVTADDLISADGQCPGLAPRGEANALTDGAAGAPASPSTGVVALGHTECDVARGVGSPDGVNLSSNERGERVALLTYSRGTRAGMYTFTAGRLSSIERGPEPVAQPKPVRAKTKKHAAAAN